MSGSRLARHWSFAAAASGAPWANPWESPPYQPGDHTSLASTPTPRKILVLGSEGMPEQYVWSEQVDITDRSMLDALFQQEITLEFVSAALANLWSLDYVNLVIDVDELSGSEPEEPEDNDTVAISEPFTFSLFGLALLGMGLSRRRSGA